MIEPMFLQFLLFCFTGWLGLYLIARNPANPRLLLTGLGTVMYACALATHWLMMLAPSPDIAMLIARLHWPLLCLPAFFWFGGLVQLLPDAVPLYRLFQNLWRYGMVWIIGPFYLLAVGNELIFDFSSEQPQPGVLFWLFAAAVLVPLLAVLAALGHFLLHQQKRHHLISLLALATLFFGLSAVALLFPLSWLPYSFILFSTSADFILMGVVIARLDALDEGETLLPDFFRNLAAAAFAVLLFSGVIGLVMLLSSGATFPLATLLLAVTAVAIIMQTFAGPIQAALDDLVFSAMPELGKARATLRNTAEALPKIDTGFDPVAVDDKEFIRLTRRALSNLGNLPKLASSPLTCLPLVSAKLSQHGQGENTLERATILKTLLLESIQRLKPPEESAAFGTSDAWRHYNALYFPYVAGLKPYSVRAEHTGLDDAAEAALDWLRTYVPERTLHNWQNAAARLIAQDLREQTKLTASDNAAAREPALAE